MGLVLGSALSVEPTSKGRDTEGIIFQRRHRNGQRIYEKVLTSLITREMRIKPQDLPLLVRKAIIKKTRDDKCGRGCGERGALVHCGWERGGAVLCRTLWRVLKKLTTEPSYDPVVPLLRTYPKETKTL